MPVDVQTFTSGSGNWTKPAGATTVRVIQVGAGGSGGGGDTAASATTVSGGAGGGGGGRLEAVFDASQLGSTEAYSVGAGASGGSGGTGLVARQVRSAEIQHSAARRLLSILLTVVVAADPVQLLFNRVAAAAVAWPALVASARLAR
jgi:hypothetical protein